MQSVRQLKEEFNEALRTEQAINAREAAYRHIAAHLRNLPASARRASDDAIQRAKEAYGDDFQIPEGKTFVRDYEYGNPTAGEVIGYVAVRRAAGGGKGKGKGGGRKK